MLRVPTLPLGAGSRRTCGGHGPLRAGRGGQLVRARDRPVLQVVHVDVVAGRDGPARVADDLAVLAHRPVGGDRAQRHLVPARGCQRVVLTVTPGSTAPCPRPCRRRRPRRRRSGAGRSGRRRRTCSCEDALPSGGRLSSRPGADRSRRLPLPTEWRRPRLVVVAPRDGHRTGPHAVAPLLRRSALPPPRGSGSRSRSETSCARPGCAAAMVRVAHTPSPSGA